MAVRVVVAGESAILREGVRAILEQRGFRVVAEAGDRHAVVPLVERVRPHVALIDLRMWSDGDGARAAEELGRRHPEVGVLVLSHGRGAAHAARLVERGRGRSGCLLQQSVVNGEVLMRAVHTVAAGGFFADPGLRDRMVARREMLRAVEELSEREWTVLALMAEGHGNLAIAAELYLSPKTVESHVRSIYAKLGLDAEPRTHRRVVAVLRYLAATETAAG